VARWGLVPRISVRRCARQSRPRAGAGCAGRSALQARYGVRFQKIRVHARAGSRNRRPSSRRPRSCSIAGAH
jgi:hypothetical protein